MNRLAPMVLLGFLPTAAMAAEETAIPSASYRQIKEFLNRVPAIDTHDHLWRFEELPGLREGADGSMVINLASIWQSSYLGPFGVPGWKAREPFQDWWQRAKPVFANVRAMS